MTIEEQAGLIAKLTDELRLLIEAGDEYHAAQVADDLVVASSLARLLHPASPRKLRIDNPYHMFTNCDIDS